MTAQTKHAQANTQCTGNIEIQKKFEECHNVFQKMRDSKYERHKLLKAAAKSRWDKVMRLHMVSKSITLVVAMFFTLEVAAKDDFTALI